MARKITKKNAKIYQDGFLRLMDEIEAIKGEYRDNEFIVDTNYGKLSFYMDDPIGSILISIHSCFNEPERVCKEIDCNRFSGKWNFYEYTPEGSLQQIKSMLSQVIDSTSRSF